MPAQNAERPDRGTIRPLATETAAQRTQQCPLGVSGVELRPFSLRCPAPLHQLLLMPISAAIRETVIKHLRHQGLTQGEIGARVGLSGARVCQILRRIAAGPHAQVGPESPVMALGDLGTRAQRCLDAHGIRTVAQLDRLTDAEMLGWPTFGVGTLNRVRRVLRAVKPLWPWVVIMGCTIGPAVYHRPLPFF